MNKVSLLLCMSLTTLYGSEEPQFHETITELTTALKQFDTKKVTELKHQVHRLSPQLKDLFFTEAQQPLHTVKCTLQSALQSRNSFFTLASTIGFASRAVPEVSLLFGCLSGTNPRSWACNAGAYSIPIDIVTIVGAQGLLYLAKKLYDRPEEAMLEHIDNFHIAPPININERTPLII